MYYGFSFIRTHELVLLSHGKFSYYLTEVPFLFFQIVAENILNDSSNGSDTMDIFFLLF